MKEGRFMTGLDRREDIVAQIQKSTVPLSGTKLAAIYKVSQGIYSEYGRFREQGVQGAAHG